jgi:hypothetical protein
MTYDLSYEEVIRLRQKYKILENFDYDSQKLHSVFFGEEKYFQSLDIGKHFLYEIVSKDKNGYKVTYPEMAIYSKWMPCDQTSEIEYLPYPRTWMWHVEYLCNPEKGYHIPVYEHPSSLKSHIEWNDFMYVYGIWDTKPKYKELKEAYSKTLWFGKTPEEIIDQKLDTIFK